MGDVAHLIARKSRVLGGRDAAGGVLFQLAEHDPGQLQERLAPPLAGDAVGLRDGQDQIFHAGKGLLRPRDYTEVDALITDTPGLSLVVFSADCGTILLYDPVHRAIGAVHAGWRGVAAGLVAKTALKMHDTFGTEPKDLLCALGPAIGPCCFETDDDVPAAMHDALGAQADPFLTRRGAKWHIDLKAINAHWLESLGVRHIDICPHCTACRQDLYWSHRKVGNARGAQIALLALEDPL